MRRILMTALVAALACGGGDSTGPKTTTLTVTNSSAKTLVEVYYSACAADVWGPNRLSEPLAPTQSKSFPVSAGCYDMQAIATDYSVAERSAVEITTGMTYTWTIAN